MCRHLHRRGGRVRQQHKTQPQAGVLLATWTVFHNEEKISKNICRPLLSEQFVNSISKNKFILKSVTDCYVPGTILNTLYDNTSNSHNMRLKLFYSNFYSRGKKSRDFLGVGLDQDHSRGAIESHVPLISEPKISIADGQRGQWLSWTLIYFLDK